MQSRPGPGRTLLQLAESFSHGSKKRRKHSFFRNLSMASINPAPQYTPLHPHALTNPSHPQHYWNHRHQPYTSITKKDFTRPRHCVTLFNFYLKKFQSSFTNQSLTHLKSKNLSNNPIQIFVSNVIHGGFIFTMKQHKKVIKPSPFKFFQLSDVPSYAVAMKISTSYTFSQFRSAVL